MKMMLMGITATTKTTRPSECKHVHKRNLCGVCGSEVAAISKNISSRKSKSNYWIITPK